MTGAASLRSRARYLASNCGSTLIIGRSPKWYTSPARDNIKKMQHTCHLLAYQAVSIWSRFRTQVWRCESGGLVRGAFIRCTKDELSREGRRNDFKLQPRQAR